MVIVRLVDSMAVSDGGSDDDGGGDADGYDTYHTVDEGIDDF